MFVTHLKKLPRGILEISCSQDFDGQTEEQQPSNITTLSTGCRWVSYTYHTCCQWLFMSLHMYWNENLQVLVTCRGYNDISMLREGVIFLSDPKVPLFVSADNSRCSCKVDHRVKYGNTSEDKHGAGYLLEVMLHHIISAFCTVL